MVHDDDYVSNLFYALEVAILSEPDSESPENMFEGNMMDPTPPFPLSSSRFQGELKDASQIP